MSSALIVDNWTLQEVSRCLSNGLESDLYHELIIDQSVDRHKYREVIGAGIQLEALIGLLSEIVLRDNLFFDPQFISTWDADKRHFSVLSGASLLRPIDFRSRDRDLYEPKKALVDLLCVTSTLRDAQTENERLWRESKASADPYLSQVLWGGAGMLSRSHVFSVPYSGHPLRGALFEQALVPQQRRDVVRETMSWAFGKRLRLYEHEYSDRTIRAVNVVLPVVMIDVINESRSVSQLIPVAFQLRDKYQKIREWLRSVQIAMDADDQKGIAKYRKVLAAVGRDLDRELGNVEDRSISFDLGLSGPSLGMKVLNIDNLLKHFGVRAMLGKHVFAPSGQAALVRLLDMFGEGQSSVGIRAIAHLQDRSMGFLGR